MLYDVFFSQFSIEMTRKIPNAGGQIMFLKWEENHVAFSCTTDKNFCQRFKPKIEILIYPMLSLIPRLSCVNFSIVVLEIMHMFVKCYVKMTPSELLNR